MLYLKGRPQAIARAAWAAKTTAQTRAHRIVRWELEVTLPVEFNLGALSLHYGLGVNFINWTHDLAVAEKAEDIKARSEQFRNWIYNNEEIQAALAGYRDAKVMANDVAELALTGGLDDREEGELQELVATIRDCVPEPGIEYCSCHCKR